MMLACWHRLHRAHCVIFTPSAPRYGMTAHGFISFEQYGHRTIAPPSQSVFLDAQHTSVAQDGL
jgi:hypothetical protein